MLSCSCKVYIIILITRRVKGYEKYVTGLFHVRYDSAVKIILSEKVRIDNFN